MLHVEIVVEVGVSNVILALLLFVIGVTEEVIVRHLEKHRKNLRSMGEEKILSTTRLRLLSLRMPLLC